MLLGIHTYRPLLSSTFSQRTLSISTRRLYSQTNTAAPPADFNRPSPPRLPKHLQEEFERLQKEAEAVPTGKLAEDGRELHPDVRRPVQAEFTGERNPVTGEIGGPKVEPTKHGDWSYGGRASDF
jgi:Protein of unknown function (DUF1674)